VTFGIEDIRSRPVQTEWDGAALLGETFEPVRYAVNTLMPEGAGLITAAPKVGKSLFVRDVAMAVATGQPLWGVYPVRQGPVLWLALEDGTRRVQERMRARADAARALQQGAITVRTTSKTLNNGGRDDLEDWLRGHPDAVLAVIDVLARVRDRDGRRSSSVYADDYAALEPLQNLAAEHRVCLPVVHHNRKLTPGDDDPFERISGTQGLLGAVDWAIVLTRRRGDDVGELHATGRDLADVRMALDFQNGLWSPSAMPIALVGKRKQVRDLWRRLDEEGDVDTPTIAKWYGQSDNATRFLLHRLLDEGLVDQVEPPAPKRPAVWRTVNTDRLPT
jgi:RecA-family ATPase